ncbi:phosphatase PAP2 family protein [Actinobacteria bacterium YIM 96077]|uniref:Phosphoesterase PA-phosphatase n=1 Tax=Phytoactinopolyspora halophila TaxID=1981511 RepID=A0A329QPA3_9ACTN|nr:phosphatase PAP2 family protein [Phytoactinopolyspora halophila]AYY15066.1 phosphatase PAP2 family protein [Actinobacteria bacterium YIM 96077]RAW14170.1 phosphoesterase PA-phosphatase [Phytoactinopolyspora halophila]
MHSSAPRFGASFLGFVMFAAGVAGTYLTWRYFVQTPTGQRLDDAAFRGAEIGQSTLWRGAEPVLDIVSVPFIVIVLGAAAIIALMRQRWMLAIQVTVLVGGANITTQLLKYVVFERPDLAPTQGAIANSLPSGHTTVAASVAAALVLVVPRYTRPAVAVLTAGYAAVTGVATMIGQWHRPSDVVAAMMVVLAWAGLTMIVTGLGTPERIRRADPAIVPTALASGLMAVVALVTGLLAMSALTDASDLLAAGDSLASRDELVRAYTGGAFGVISITAVVFAAILVVHQLASRPGPVRAVDKKAGHEDSYR